MLWVSQTNKALRRLIWPYIKKATKPCLHSKSEIDHTVVLEGGGRIECASAEGEVSIRGGGFDGVVVDEAPFIAEQTWKQVIRPTLIDRGGWVLMIGTPNGFNWFKTRFDLADELEDHARWQEPTWKNPLITRAELDAIKAEIGEQDYAQEIGAQFVQQEGVYFDQTYFEKDIWFEHWPLDRCELKVITLDPSLGKSESADYSAFCLLLLSSDGTFYVDCNMARRDSSRIIEDAMILNKHFEPQVFGVESNAFQEILAKDIYRVAKERKVGLPLEEIVNTTNKEVRIKSTLTSHLSQGNIRFKKGSSGARMLVEQLKAFPSRGVHDDGPDALEMAVRLAYQWVHSKLAAVRGGSRVTPIQFVDR